MNISRRRLLRECGNGVGMLGLAGLVAQTAAASQTGSAGARTGHHRVRAKRLIFLFMAGGPSHVDLFDPKPKLTEYNGRPAPFRLPDLERTPPGNVQRSPFGFKKYGESGIEVSELFPQVARHVDDLCVIRSMVADNINHNGACLQMNTGEQTFSRPSMGSWLLYGLGTENQNLPGYVVVAPNQPAQGAPLWDASFLPASYQGTCVTDLARPIANLKNGSSSPDVQRRGLDLIGTLNRFHREASPNRDELDARIASFELAFRMQTAAPEAFDIGLETKQTQEAYGLNRQESKDYGRQCLIARRLIERGVRFIQVFADVAKTPGGGVNDVPWDAHSDISVNHGMCARSVDQPTGALLDDLKQRGLLDDTLVIYGGEFGRTSDSQGAKGRDHNPNAFTTWMAGGGVKGGTQYGSTDTFGYKSVEKRVSAHDLHATILKLMGFDHEKLTYRFNGRDFRLTDVAGDVIDALIA